MIVSGSSAKHRECENALELVDGLADRTFKVYAFLQVLFDQVSDDLGIRFGDELMILFPQFVLKLQVVFDNAVMDDDDMARAITMRMGIFLSRPPVCRPARMSETIGSIERFLTKYLFKIAQLTFCAANLQVALFINDRYARRVVTAIFELAQSVND